MDFNKETIKSAVITVVGIVLSAYGLLLCVLSNLNIGVLLVAGIGFVTVLAGLFYSKIKQLGKYMFCRVCKTIIAILMCIEIVLVSFIALYGVADNACYDEDAVIVLGAGVHGDVVSLPLKKRLDKAIEYHRNNPDAIIVVSGGQGLQETVTEAYAMEKYLVEHGVDKSKIFKEEKAVSTYENMVFSKEVLDKHFANDYSVVVVTNHFHIFRSVTMAKNAGFDSVAHIHGGLEWYNVLPCFLRESLAVIKLFVIG